MKKIVVLVAAIVLMIFVAGAAYAELPQASNDIIKHLEFLGYKIEKKDASFSAKKANAATITFRLYKKNIIMMAYFTLDEAHGDRAGLLEEINTLNLNASLCRYYVDSDNDLVAECMIADSYDKVLFGATMDFWAVDSYTTVYDKKAELYNYLK